MPFLSVIIPTCHRNDTLALCLERLAPGSQSLRTSEYEVIVTDDGSRSTAATLVKDRFPWAQWVAGPRRGPAANRNHGAWQARGEWLVFIDDDCLPSPGWLEAIAQAAQMAKADLVEGRTECPGAADHPLVERVHNQNGGSYWSCNLAVKQAAFSSLGGFDEAFSEAAMEDMEFAWRFQKRGYRAVFEPSALVTHPPRRITWRKYWWRTVTHQRWHLLYEHKIGTATSLKAPTFIAVSRVAANTALNLLRTTWHVVRDFDPSFWRSALFLQLWRWLTFPYLAVYLMVWETRFRQQLIVENSQADSISTARD